MKLSELVEMPIGAMAQASVQRHPELEWKTPEVAEKLSKWAAENGYPMEYVVCAMLNWLGTFCEDTPQPNENN